MTLFLPSSLPRKTQVRSLGSQLFLWGLGAAVLLLILRHRLKAVQHKPAVTIVKEYGEMPPIHVYPGPLNQVLMNLLSNAIDAVDEQVATNPQFQPKIRIQTGLRDAIATIRISDNGPGIPDSVRSRLKPISRPNQQARELG